MDGFVDVTGGRLEVLDLPGDRDAPALVLLHEGLGSVGLWRDVPAELNRGTGLRTVVFSRFGHGRSAPPPRPRTPSFMHEEAREVLPELFAALSIERPILVGHSDGASIALVYASEHDVSGLVLLAPHVFVEEVCVTEIAQVNDGFEERLRERMARHHDDPAVTFHGWADVWLDPAFLDWSLVPLLPGVTAPTLLIQGLDDQYGTLAQVEAVADGISGPAEILTVPGGHSPHLEQHDRVLEAVLGFVRALAPGATPA